MDAGGDEKRLLFVLSFNLRQLNHSFAALYWKHLWLLNWTVDCSDIWMAMITHIVFFMRHFSHKTIFYPDSRSVRNNLSWCVLFYRASIFAREIISHPALSSWFGFYEVSRHAGVLNRHFPNCVQSPAQLRIQSIAQKSPFHYMSRIDVLKSVGGSCYWEGALHDV